MLATAATLPMLCVAESSPKVTKGIDMLSPTTATAPSAAKDNQSCSASVGAEAANVKSAATRVAAAAETTANQYVRATAGSSFMSLPQCGAWFSCTPIRTYGSEVREYEKVTEGCSLVTVRDAIGCTRRT